MNEPLFSVCTLVTDKVEYARMRASFTQQGFAASNTEFLYLDNTVTNQWDAFSGIARFMFLARGRFVIICHQDIRLLEGIECLQTKLAELDAFDPAWALAGNAGGTLDSGIARRISDPHGEDQRIGEFPARAASLDENFIILRRDAPIGISSKLSGFHFYGTDLCLQARFAGRSAWIIDFHLRHHSAGRVDRHFHETQQALEAHYDQVLARPWSIRTTCTKLILGGGGLRRWLARRRLKRRLLRSEN